MTDTCELSTQPILPEADVKPPASGPSLLQRVGQAIQHYADVLRTVGTAFVVFGIFAVQGILLARLLGPQRRGEYGTAVFYTQALTYIGLLGTLLSIARRAAQHPDALPSLRRASIRLGILTGLVTAVVVSMLALAALPASKQSLAPLCILCACMLPCDHVRLALLAVDHGSGAFRKYNRNLLVNAATLPTLLVLLWALGIESVETAAAATLLVPVTALAYRFCTEGRGYLGRHAEPPARTLVVEGFPYALAQTSSNLFNRLDGLLMLWLASFTVQGYYAAAISAANVLVAAPEALALFAFRSSAQSSERLESRKFVNASLMVAAIQCVSLVGLFVLLEPLIVLVFGPGFRGAVPYARLLLPAHAICGLTYVAGGYLRGRGKSSIEVWSRLLGAAVMVVSVFALRPHWNDLSIPLAAICGHTACAAYMCLAAFRDVRQPAPEPCSQPVAS